MSGALTYGMRVAETGSAEGSKFGQETSSHMRGPVMQESAMQEHDSSMSEQTKTCPRCGAELFSDMDKCYGCLYDFARKPAPEARRQEGFPPDATEKQHGGHGKYGQDERPLPFARESLADLDEPSLSLDLRNQDYRARRSQQVEKTGPRHASSVVASRQGRGRKADSCSAFHAVEKSASSSDTESLSMQPSTTKPDCAACSSSERACHKRKVTSDLGDTDDLWGQAASLQECSRDANMRPSLAGGPDKPGAPANSSTPCFDGVSFVWIRSSDMELTIPIPSQGLIIGRSPICDVVLHSRAVSHRHVMLVPRREELLVEDLGATNPAILHGRQVLGATSMNPGDMLDVCGTFITYVRDAT